MMNYFSEVITCTPLNPKLCSKEQIVDRIIRLREALSPVYEMRIPSERDLALTLNICHVTVHNAYKHLSAQGVIRAKGSRGTFLLPLHNKLASRINPFSLAGEDPPAYTRLAGHLPLNLDVAVLEMSSESNLVKISDRMYKALHSKARRKLKGDCSDESLATQIQKKLSQEGLYTGPENIFMPSRGTALRAVAAALLKPDDLVVMETGQDAGPYTIFRSLGCEVALSGSAPGDGMDMNALEAICRQRKVRAVFIRADSSWPFGIVTGNESRERLIALSKSYDFRIIAYEYESEYAIVNLPPRLSVQAHEGRVIFVSVLSRASRMWECAGYVVAEPRLIRVLKENDALLDGPRCRSLDQIAAVMHSNGSLRIENERLSQGHEVRLKMIASRLRARLKDKARVVKPECGRFIILQFEKPVHVRDVELLSTNLNMNYYERNQHLKEDQTISCLRIEYTVFKEAEWDAFILEFTRIIKFY